MKNLLQQTIDLLKQKVKENLEVIKVNQVDIKAILKEPTSDLRTRRFDEKYQYNKELLGQNNDFINIQLALINFLEKYKDTPVLDEGIEVENVYDPFSKDDAFELTVMGKLTYNHQHPFYHDSDFFNNLMVYYQQNEAYEKCGELLKTKK
ncbi:MAG: hypothetical protein HC896_17630 [Bacteroidales bacterium]|nr:hypothetical protein [Bacteroidales bacterium]